MPHDFDAALTLPNALAAWDIDTGSERTISIFELSHGGALPVAWKKVPATSVGEVTRILEEKGLRIGNYDGHRSFVWLVTPDAITVWSREVEILRASEGVIIDATGRRLLRSELAGIVGYLDEGFVDRGIKAEKRDGSRLTVLYELSMAAANNFMYDRLDALFDTGWIPELGSALAEWAGVPFRDELGLVGKLPTPAVALDFDGIRVTERNIGALLRDASHGSVPVRDLDAALNPGFWAGALAHQVAQGALRAALVREVTAMFRSSDPRERALALSIHDSAQPALLEAGALWQIFQTLAAEGRTAEALEAAQGLHILAGRGQAIDYDGHAGTVRDLLLRSETPRALADSLLTFVGDSDRAWLLEHFEILRAGDDQQTLLRIGEVATRLGSAELRALAESLGVRFATAGMPLPRSTLDTLAAMIDARRRAGR